MVASSGGISQINIGGDTVDEHRAIKYIQEAMARFNSGTITRDELDEKLFLIAYWVMTDKPEDEPIGLI